jgi:uracil-DNA glycosylase family 4
VETVTRNLPRQLQILHDEIANCRTCDRLVAWREAVAVEKRASFRDDEYWGRPVPGFGDAFARLYVVGLAPAAHGANRTGRMFTGDRSGDWLYRALHKAGFANQPTSTHQDDGLQLYRAWVGAAVRCAPPDNKPTPDERRACEPFLTREMSLLSDIRVVVCLGSIAYEAMCRQLEIRPRPKFAHGLEIVHGALTILCSYHPSQQNTFTGKLTEPMFDSIFSRARELCI